MSHLVMGTTVALTHRSAHDCIIKVQRKPIIRSTRTSLNAEENLQRKAAAITSLRSISISLDCTLLYCKKKERKKERLKQQLTDAMPHREMRPVPQLQAARRSRRSRARRHRTPRRNVRACYSNTAPPPPRHGCRRAVAPPCGGGPPCGASYVENGAWRRGAR